MKLLIVFSLSALMLAAADGLPKKNRTPKSVPTAAARKAPIHNGIPARAVKSDDGSYYYTDAQGKKWIYRRTPFGIARVEDRPEDAAARIAGASRGFEDTKATEDGDTIRFERPSPFGVYKWQRKKTELDAIEQSAWDRERARATTVRQNQ